MYRTATVYFTTGTGNSYRTAVWTADLAGEAGAAARVMPIEGADPAAQVGDGPEHLLGLTLPTHGFTAPWHMIRAVARLPRRHGTHAFVIAGRAGLKVGPLFVPGMEGTAAYLPALILVLKGYRVRGAMGLDVPCSWLALHPGFGEVSARAILARAEAKTRRFMGRVLGGATAFWSLICVVLGLLLLPVTLAYLLIGRFVIAKTFFASSRCNGCGLCAASCPVGAIRMSGRRRPRPFWTHPCESCQRCIGFCPQGAVEAGHSYIALLWYCLATAPFAIAGRNALQAWCAAATHSGSAWVTFLVDNVYLLAWVYASYPVLLLLLRIPLVNALFTHTTLTHYWRRYHEPDTQLRDLLPPPRDTTPPPETPTDRHP